MQKNYNILRGHPWLLLLMLFMWVTPRANAEAWVEDPNHFSVSLGGSNIVYFSAPVYDQKNVDQWISSGKLKVSVDDGAETTIFEWQSSKNISGDATEVSTKFSTSADGFFDITKGNTRETYRLTKSNDDCWLNVKRNSDGYSFSFEAEWVVPYNLLGKKLKFTWDVKRDGNSPWKEVTVPNLKSVTINMPAAAAKLKPFVAAPMLNPRNPGKLELPWYLASDNITKGYYEYEDANGKKQKVDINNVSSGTIMLDANIPYRKFHIVCSYKEKGDKGEYEIENVSSSTHNLAMIHAPVGLTARALDERKAKVELKWTVPYVEDDDLVPTDFFEVQRSLTGKEEDFVAIGQLFYSKNDKKRAFTYIDSTLVDDIQPSMLKNGGTLDNLTYRVRRTITKEWGWTAANNCASSTRCIVDNLHLLRIANYSAKWEDERAYTVRVSWDYANEYHAIWDDRAQMVLHVVSKNNAGAVVDDQTYKLDANERAQRYKILNLSRSCVHYDIDMYVERGESPINFVEQLTPDFFPIRSESDWLAFCKMVSVAGGRSDVNARLYADITISGYAGYSTTAPYQGIFDGNGYTLTYNTDVSVEDVGAPFRYVGNATIRNLHTAGTNKTSDRYRAGLVGQVLEGSTVNIENCRSSVTINSSVNGDATNGGFVAVMSGTVTIRNCKFDGSFEGANCSHNGGFVGWVNGGSSLTIENSIFAPDHITTKLAECQTWARLANDNAKFSNVNCYATSEYKPYITIRSASDWNKFRTMVEDAKNGYDVDAVLQADITTSDYVGGGEAAYYRGTFDGNGYTITFNKSGWTENYIAPFRYAGNATIKNLHTAGSIQSSGTYATGLVAALINNTTVTIENCQSSVKLNCTGSGDKTLSGFVGRLQDCTLTIRNCKFDGSFEGASSYGHAGFVSWAATNTNVTIENCLFAPDHLSTMTNMCNNWARKDGDASAKLTVTNCHATKDFSVFVIRSSADWDTFREMITIAEGNYYLDAWLAADITTKQSAAMQKSWTGTFNGNGHTITVDIDGGYREYIALFHSTRNHTIKNLHVKGKIKGGRYSAGLVGYTNGSYNHIDNCRVSVDLNYDFSSTGNGGGFVGDGANKPQVITNCLFDGTMSTIPGSNPLVYAAAFIGWQDNKGNQISGNSFNNNLENGTYPKNSSNINATYVGMNFYLSGLTSKPQWANGEYGSNNWTYHAVEARFNLSAGGNVQCWSEASQVGSKSASEMVTQLGSGNWKVDGDKVVPIMADDFSTNPWYAGTISASQQVEALGKDAWTVVDGKAVPIMVPIVDETTMEEILKNLPDGWKIEGDDLVPAIMAMDEPQYATITKPTLPDFYHKNTGTIDKVLLTQTRQSSVLLSWNTDGSPIDYFTVKRRVKGEGEDAWKEIATNIDQMSYEDTSVSPLTVYEYKVLGVNDCEGISTTETEVKVGESKHTGRVEGYVRFNDGTGAPNIEVAAMYKDKKVTSVKTDESGYFEIDELSYQGGTKVDYKVGPVKKGDVEIKYERDDYQVTFDATTNNVTLNEFTINNGKRFSGYVMYDGTSIPVKGVNFLVNGQKVHNAKGDFVESDYDGSFSFRLVGGSVTIQAVKDNHVFTNDGWYKNSSKQSINDDIAGIYFYDATKVKLTGRVVGGDDQGSKPLMNNLSKNNLGDSLRMVLTLEGDNTSWLVYDNLNPNRTTREEVVRHPRGGDKHFTRVTTERKRMVVLPDPTTGEYLLMLPPVRWKVQQVYCKGYGTLFQEGQLNEVIDLTDCLTPVDTTYKGSYKDIDTLTVASPKANYHAIYNRIYHSPVEVTYKQIGYDNFDYFGDKSYYATELTGKTAEVPLAYGVKKPNWPATRSDSLETVYTFGHPVFSLERKYNILLQVAERYYYNNDRGNGTLDMVRLGGGKVRMQNGMKSVTLEGIMEDPVEIDSLGQARLTLQANQLTTLLKGENALRTVTFTVERDGTFIEAEPLRGFVLNMFPIGSSRDIMTEGKPILYDVLRDPPGGYSSNTLAKGATLNNTYMMNLTITAGLYMNFKYGEKLETVSAAVQTANTTFTSTGSAVGPINASDAESAEVDMFMYNGNGSKAFSHTMVVGNNVSTSGDPSMIGADADLYIGSVQNVIVTPMSTIRAVTDSMYQSIIARTAPKGGMISEVGKSIEYGTVVEIASGERPGKNGKKEKFHLIRDVALGYGPSVQSQFIYSQKQLLKQIIPAKAKEIVDLMFLGTKAEAQAIANRTKHPVYLSLRQPTDSTFAVVNQPLKGHVFNDSIDKAQPGYNYLVVVPSDKQPAEFSDEVAEKYQVIKAWADMIAMNEKEKMNAHDLLVNYDVAGAAGVNYSETFDASYTESWSNFFPIVTEVDYFGVGRGVSMAASSVGIAGSIASAIALSLKEMKTWSVPQALMPIHSMDDGSHSSIVFGGKLFQWTLFPVASYTTVGADSEARSYNRTENFTIALDPQSHLNVDVYRAGLSNGNKQTVDVSNVFTNDNFSTYYDEVSGRVNKSLQSMKINGPRGFIFRTRGGSTRNPWEDQRVTQVYSPGSMLDARTLKVCNPKIRLDKQSVSGVSINDAAHFTVYLSNESEKPEAADNPTVLQLFANDQMNPLGAKISVNGQPLTTGGMAVSVVPGMETALQMEVRAGQGFDFEKLVIGVMSPTDPDNTTALTSFDVHFLREAGGVSISMPGDKWVLNTNAAKDAERGWYIPVTINGFDRHQHNFDHIEFQYKESQRGDDAWTNLCSYYAKDSLMQKANGVRELIPENGNITTRFYGEGWVTERTYDLRAVVFCRNGSDFLTTPSKIISGIKDTRRPQLFGTPEPKSGLLTAGDNIIFNFSEDIEYNHLSAITNFEVKGEVNNNSLSEMVSVQFDGKGSLESEAKRNFSGKNLTIDLMVKPNDTGRDMPLFSHGTNGQKLQLWLTKDYKLKGVVNDQTFVSDSTISGRGFNQVAMVLNQTDSTVTFFNGGVQAGKPHKLTALYTGTGPLIYGRTNELDRKTSQYYEGRMMEARLWYSAMDGILIGTTYGNQRLTGYEKDLVDYYPMFEGSGEYVLDYTQGANAKMIETSWAIPRGISLKLAKEDKGMLLDKNALNRGSDHDYTLMFWFKTDADGRGTLLSNGRGLKEDNGAENQFHIGFEGDKLMYRSNGFAIEVPGNWSDNQWHNFAMTVSRGRNIANIYVDKELRTTFGVDSLGGISGGYPLIGATRYDVLKENGEVEVVDGTDAMAGYVDELMFFAQALPQQLIKSYTSKSPKGDETGLLTYLGFDRIERQKDNDLEVVPYAYSKKLYLDDKGNPRYQLDPLTKEPTDTLVRDYPFVDPMDAVLKHFDKTQAAPVVPDEEVKNLKFSFVGKGNQVLVDLDEPAARLNHRNIYVTLRDIEDKNGNTMASPQTACYYVNNSSLQWMVNRLDYTIKYGNSEQIDLPFYNNGSQNHTYKIENCPKWLQLNNYSDVLAPQTLGSVTASINPDLNIGTYNEIIYLIDEEGITEPFYLNLTVEGEKPDWASSINNDLLQHSMNISGQVYLYGELDTDSRDIVGVFDNENVCHGYANITHNEQKGETALYLTVYDKKDSGTKLNFRLWQYSTGRELVLTPDTEKNTILFEKSSVLGTDKPVRFDGGKDFVQTFSLETGWNWVSFNVKSKNQIDMNTLISSMNWTEGDMVTDLNSDTTLVFKNNQWMASGNPVNMIVSAKKAYAIKVQKDCKFFLGGTAIKEKEDRTINLKKGWNGIGYTPMVNLPIETALSDYFDHASDGDVIKSHTEFAYFTKSGNTGHWRGSLQMLKPGEGYMMLRKDADPASFSYPYYDKSTNFNNSPAFVATRGALQMPSTMNISAMVEGVDVEEGDRLVAYSDGEQVGSAELATLNEELTRGFFLSIAGDIQKPIWFAIEREGEIVASTKEIMSFQKNAVLGSPNAPTAIRFVEQDAYEGGEWYTVGGVKLQQKPTSKGVYIFNGRKVVIK